MKAKDTRRAWHGTIRPYQDDDIEFFREMTLLAFYSGPQESAPPFEQAMHNPFYAAWIHDWPQREGDVAFVAEGDAGRRVGAAWRRFFPFANRSYGSVSPAVPEIGLAVIDGMRGTGVGTALLHALLEHAKAAGVLRLSLSVDAANPARRLYAREGFREAGIIMVAQLE